jgi:hypothetical protein
MNQVQIAGPPKGLQPWQAPDEGAYSFVTDMMRERFGVNTNEIDKLTIPLGVLGTLDWIAICGWWAWTNTGIFDSSEAYSWVFRYVSEQDEVIEMSPDMLLVFREDRELNCFEERFQNPELTRMEAGEAVQFLKYDVYQKMTKSPPPDAELLELILYCTFLWVLSDNGKEWLCKIDPVWHCVDDFGVAFLNQWEGQLLDPRRMECTERKIGSCAMCKNSLFCVAGAQWGPSWFNLCVECMNKAHEEDSHEMDEMDRRLIEPSCLHRGGQCKNTACPHNPLTDEDVQGMFHEAGSRRLDEWREQAIEGDEQRSIAGMTVDDIVDMFR